MYIHVYIHMYIYVRIYMTITYMYIYICMYVCICMMYIPKQHKWDMPNFSPAIRWPVHQSFVTCKWQKRGTLRGANCSPALRAPTNLVSSNTDKINVIVIDDIRKAMTFPRVRPRRKHFRTTCDDFNIIYYHYTYMKDLISSWLAARLDYPSDSSDFRSQA